MSMSARKRRNRREVRRLGWKRYRAAESRAIRGGRLRTAHYAERWGNVGSLKQNTLPLD